MDAKKRLLKKIKRLVDAEVSNSWAGSGELADIKAAEEELRKARKSLNREIDQLFAEEKPADDDYSGIEHLQ